MKWPLLVALVACGDDLAPPITAEPRSGTRLRLQRLLYEDGTRQLASTTEVFDRERDEPCTIAQWSDGLRYCTPAAHRGFYIDDACTQEAARQRSVEPDKRYGLHEFFLGDTPKPSRLHELGAEIPRDQVTDVFELRDGRCVPRFDTADQDRFYLLGDEVPRTELVHTRRVEVPAGDRLAALVDTSPDGLQLPAKLFDTEQQHDCDLVPRADGSASCEPVGIALSVRFADAACTVPAVTVPAADPLPDLVRRANGLACDTFHDIGELLVVPTAYTRSGDVCSESPLEIGERVFGLGAPIEIATLERTRIDGQRRLQLIEDGDSGFPDPKLFDTELQQECSILELDRPRCVPVFERARDAFSDPTCLAAIRVLEVAPACSAPPTLLQARTAGTFHPVLGPLAEVFELTTGDRCAPALHVFDDSTFHLAGDEIDATAFVPAMHEID